MNSAQKDLTKATFGLIWVSFGFAGILNLLSGTWQAFALMGLYLLITYGYFYFQLGKKTFADLDKLAGGGGE